MTNLRILRRGGPGIILWPSVHHRAPRRGGRRRISVREGDVTCAEGLGCRHLEKLERKRGRGSREPQEEAALLNPELSPGRLLSSRVKENKCVGWEATRLAMCHSSNGYSICSGFL